MFSTRLKDLRMEKNLTQKQLAEILHMQNTAISKYELGERKPDQEILIKLAEYFHTTTDYLLGNSDIRNPYKEGNGEYKKEINFLESFRSAMMERGFDYFKEKTHEELADIAVKFIKANDIINNNDNKSN